MATGKHPPEAAAIAGRLRLTDAGLIWDNKEKPKVFATVTQIDTLVHFFLKLDKALLWLWTCLAQLWVNEFCKAWSYVRKSSKNSRSAVSLNFFKSKLRSPYNNL
jgi:hypothetical protein